MCKPKQDSCRLTCGTSLDISAPFPYCGRASFACKIYFSKKVLPVLPAGKVAKAVTSGFGNALAY